ncbi:hypothetical protein ACFLZY_00770 [Patescibacteria group bacterium]
MLSFRSWFTAKKIIVFLLIFVAASLVVFFSFNKIQFVKFGQEFTVKAGELVVVPQAGLSFRIKEFIYSPCPPGFQCAWSGLAVYYDFRHNGSPVSESDPYDYVELDTDYQTFAKVLIHRTDDDCKTLQGTRFYNGCLGELAIKEASDEQCLKIVDDGMRWICIKRLAGQTKDYEACRSVQDHWKLTDCYNQASRLKEYSNCDDYEGEELFRDACRYIESERQNNPDFCSDIQFLDLRDSCWHHLTGKNKGQSYYCGKIENSSLRDSCWSMLAGLGKWERRFCEQIEDAYYYGSCLTKAIIQNIHGEEICNEVNDQRALDHCYSILASHFQNQSYCNKIVSESSAYQCNAKFRVNTKHKIPELEDLF